MPTITWTPQQLQAINSRGKDILVSASAGSGKTTVMIRRVLALIAEGYELKDMIIVTFTVAAAADMKEKLSRELSASDDPRLRAQLNALADADISTLHGWCKRQIGAYFYRVDADPEFAVAEETEREALLARAADRAVREETDKGDPDFLELLEIFGDSADDWALKTLVLRAFNNSAVSAEEARILSDGEYKKLLSDDLNARRAALLEKAEDLSLRTQQAKFTRNIAAADALCQAVRNYALPARAPSGKIPPAFTDLNDEYALLKKRAAKLAGAFAAAASAGEQSGKYLVVLDRLRRKTADIFLHLKREKGLLDFNDMERYALEILRSPSGEEIRARYKFIFVDEYQDINPLQDALISALHAGNRLFLVGDLKQSIYAFRGCEPAIFAEKFARFSSDPDCEVIELNSNHRSCDGVLSYVNDVFSRVMTGEFGGADYARRGAFTLGGKKGAGVKIHLCPKSEREEEELYDLTRHKASKIYMAEQAALTIAEILAHQTVEENGQARPAMKKDIAVLVRSLNGETVAALAARLNGLGIKTNLAGQEGEVEAQTLTAYLRLIDNRLDDDSLINSMRGYFGGFSDGELAEIRQSCRDDCFFYEAAERFLAQGSNSELSLKLNTFFSRLDAYRKLSQTLPVRQLAGQIAADFNYFQYAFSKGAAAADALDKFLEYIADSRAADLSAFLADCTCGAALPGGGDSVKIMTVHASKGLEFPFVILLNAEKRFNLRSLYDPILIHKQNAAIKCYDRDSFTVKPSAGWLYNQSRLKQRMLEEELRLLYVALTRTKYSVDIFAQSKKNDAGGKEPFDAVGWTDWLMQAPFPPLAAVAEDESYDVQPLTDNPQSRPAVFPPAPPALVCALQKRFYDSPVTASSAPPKAYVTAIIRQDDEDTQGYVCFKDDRTGGKDNGDINAAQKGVLYHKAMELIDFSGDFDAQWDALDDMIKTAVDKEQIRRAAAAMRDLCAGKKYYKEQGFMLRIAAREVGFEGGGDVLLQGVIDLLILDGEECIIADYKTGSFKEDYKKQLYYYGLAAQRILAKKVKNKIVYMFKDGKLWDL